MRLKTSIVLAALAVTSGITSYASASTSPPNTRFTIATDSINPLLDSYFHYSTTGNPSGANINYNIANAPLNVANVNPYDLAVSGGVLSLAPTWTSVSLYSVTEQGLAPEYGIAVAVSLSAWNNGAGGMSFDQLFGANINASFGDTNTHTEATLISEFLADDVEPQYIAGITATPAADVPYGQAGVIEMFSGGYNGGNISVVAGPVPEPASMAIFSIGALGFLKRRRRIV
jgi:hypothetical protein